MPGKFTESSKNDHASIAIILARKPDRNLQKDIKNIKCKQRTDVRMNKIINKLEKGEKRHEYCFRNGILMKGKPGQERVVLTQEIMKKLISEAHELYGHIGGLKCYKLISEDFFYPTLKQNVARYVRSCVSCQLNKIYTQNSQAPTTRIVPSGPGDPGPLIL